MTSKNISTLDKHYFQFHIVATFAEFLNDIEQHSYETLDDGEWWEECAKEFIPIISDKTQKLEDTQKKLFQKVMSKFPEKFLSEAQTKELLEYVGLAVQSCGICIDSHSS